MHAPAALAAAVAEEKEMSDRGSCTLDQLALATLLTSGRFDRHLRRMRAVYAARRTALTGAFTRHAHRVQLTGLAAGFQAVAPLPPGADEAAVIAAARRRRVGLHGIGDFCGNPGAAPPGLVMGFGNVRERAIEPAIAAIADLLGLPGSRSLGLRSGDPEPRQADPWRKHPRHVGDLTPTPGADVRVDDRNPTCRLRQ
jgi:GntR family transcriptional regulator/MocR family aminotransferase